ncbi:hypothetical protein EDC94DRAFT_614370 [Helicostylum pulchrum]|nr:hypothetical protein EDC94DRAFT_614370 [Helicostylum pulchrum]
MSFLFFVFVFSLRIMYCVIKTSKYRHHSEILHSLLKKSTNFFCEVFLQVQNNSCISLNVFIVHNHTFLQTILSS